MGSGHTVLVPPVDGCSWGRSPHCRRQEQGQEGLECAEVRTMRSELVSEQVWGLRSPQVLAPALACLELSMADIGISSQRVAQPAGGEPKPSHWWGPLWDKWHRLPSGTRG